MEHNKRRYRRRPSTTSEAKKALSSLSRTNPCPGYTPVYNQHNRDVVANSVVNGLNDAVHTTPSNQNSPVKRATKDNAKNFARNMQMLNEFVGRLPSDQLAFTFKSQDQSRMGS